MAYLQGSFPIIQKQQFNSDTYSFYIRCPEMAAQTVPGQFVNLKIPGFSLRRPISVCQRDDEVLRLVFQIRGEGTKELAALEPGMKADLLGPLGNGSPQKPKSFWQEAESVCRLCLPWPRYMAEMQQPF